MTDEELVERLRGWAKDIQEGSTAIYAMDLDLKEAADRIEALTKERDETDDLWSARVSALTDAIATITEQRGAVEAKLAKAVEAAEQLASDAVPCVCNYCLEARATLAEIKGEGHE